METEKTLYLYVYESIITSIYNGKYAYGEHLPSFSELCIEYNVGRNTIRNAMTKLQENEFIKLEKGTRAKVIMNIYDTNINQRYLQSLVNRRKMSSDAFTTLEWIMPGIITICLRHASKEDIQMLEDKIQYLNDHFDEENNKDLMFYLMDIYLSCLSILHSPLLNDLFTTMMHMMVLPFSNHKTNPIDFSIHVKKIKKILITIIRFVIHGNEFMVAKIIKTFISLYCKLILEHVDKLCVGVTPTHSYKMQWLFRSKQIYLYNELVLQLMRDIHDEVFKQDDVLPSISELSSMYHVSTRTSRKAIKILNSLGVLQTINGVGSKVVVKKYLPNETLACDEVMIKAANDSYDAIKLLSLIACCIIERVMLDMSKETKLRLILELENGDQCPCQTLYMYIFSSCNDFLQDIYKELSNPLLWEMYIYLAIDITEYKALEDEKRQTLIHLLKGQKYRKVAILLQEPMDAWGMLTYDMVKNHRLKSRESC